ncbi:hypothetical protein [Micromonospora rosaria]|nr:hypothetical protein [Micromonospora rosaria]
MPDFRTRCASVHPTSGHRCDLDRGHSGSHEHNTSITWPQR